MAVEKEALFAEKRDDSNDERPMGQNRKKFTERKLKDLRFYILMMALPIIQFIIMYIGVNINSFLLSVKEYDLNTGGYKFLTGNIFQNFIDAFQEIQGKDFFKVIENSMVLFIATILISIPLGVAFSYYIFKKMPAYGFFRIMLYLPCIISSVVMVTIYNSIMEVALPKIMGMITGEKIPLGYITNPETTRTMLIIYTVFFSFGPMTMVISSNMSGINASLIEAAQLDGCNNLQEFIYIVFPLSFNVIKLQLISALVAIFTHQMQLYTFFGLAAYPKDWTLGYYLYRGVLYYGEKKYPYYAAMGLIFSAVAIPIIMMFRALFDRLDPSVEKKGR